LTVGKKGPGAGRLQGKTAAHPLLHGRIAISLYGREIFIFDK
jgi:hypothetical protein